MGRDKQVTLKPAARVELAAIALYLEISDKHVAPWPRAPVQRRYRFRRNAAVALKAALPELRLNIEVILQELRHYDAGKTVLGLQGQVPSKHLRSVRTRRNLDDTGVPGRSVHRVEVHGDDGAEDS